MKQKQLTLSVLPVTLAVCRLNKDETIPKWAMAGEFFSVTRTEDELSVVCAEGQVPKGVLAERDWRALKVEGPLNFSLVGILASLTEALARAGVSVFTISTYDTDYLLVKANTLEAAIAALEEFCIVRQ